MCGCGAASKQPQRELVEEPGPPNATLGWLVGMIPMQFVPQAARIQARIMQLSFWRCCRGSSPPWVQALGLPALSRQRAGQEGWLHHPSSLQARRRMLEISGDPFGEQDTAAWAGLGLP